MKKKLIRIWLVYFLAGAILYAVLKYLLNITMGKDVDFMEIISTSVIYSLLFSLAIVFGSYYFFPRNKYLDRNDAAKPSFKIACSSIIDLPQGLDFSSLKNVIAEKWMITFSDDKEHVLKFTNKRDIIQTHGVSAAWMKLDADAGKIQLECFPLAGIQENNKALKMQNDFIELMQRM